MHGDGQLATYVVTGAIILIVMVRRFQRVGKQRPLKLEQLWVAPAIYFAICVALFLQAPPSDIGWLWCLLALVVGAVGGWYRGRTITIGVDPATHALNQATSPWGLVFVVALILVRFALRAVLADEASGLHVGASTLVDVFLSLALGLIGVQRLEMFLRARRLLAAARAGL